MPTLSHDRAEIKNQSATFVIFNIGVTIC
jgi:hypothetical protein